MAATIIVPVTENFTCDSVECSMVEMWSAMARVSACTTDGSTASGIWPASVCVGARTAPVRVPCYRILIAS